MTETYDVVVCGGGLAGLTLARQLKLDYPDISIVVLERASYPLPPATCKVGESTVEIAAFYLAESLCLHNYFKNNHLTKLGLRFFYGDGQRPLSERPEQGLTSFPSVDSFQIDRGIFENDLCEMNKLAGIDVWDGVNVRDIKLSEQDHPHLVEFTSATDPTKKVVQGKWMIDAMGRRSFLQRKLKLRTKVEDNHSAAWFRLPGRLDIDELVPKSEGPWHRRVDYGTRRYSTNHLMGPGYWVWIIPLPSGITSVGIVSSEKIHPIINYNTQEKAIAWLQKHEPVLGNRISDTPFLDFGIRKNYAYSSQQVFSERRWACTGEAAVFSDPFYSTGTNIIGFANTIISRMIGLDRNRKLTTEEVDRFNNFLLSYNDGLIETIHPSYSYFGNAQIMSLNYLWDVTAGWAVTAPQMINSTYLNAALTAELQKIMSGYSTLALRVKQLFKAWEERTNDRFTFDFIDYLSIPFIQEIYQRNLRPGKNAKELAEDYRKNIEVIENFALAIFLMAIEDVMPEQLQRCEEAPGLNAQAISLRANRWSEEGLFRPQQVKGACFEAVRTQIRNAYGRQESHLAIEELIDTSFGFNFDVKQG